MARKANGQGHTYKVGNSYRTVIRKGGHCITAMASTSQESRRLAKEKLELKPNLLSKSLLPVARIQFGEYLISWLDEKWGKKKNYDKFLMSGMEKKDGCVIYEVYEEEYIMLIEDGKDDEERKVLELVGNLK